MTSERFMGSVIILWLTILALQEAVRAFRENGSGVFAACFGIGAIVLGSKAVASVYRDRVR